MKRNKGTMKFLFSEDIQYVRGRKRQKNRIKPVAAILVAAVLVAFSAGSFVMIDSIYADMFGRAEKPEYSIYQTYDDLSRDFGRETVTFMSEGNELTGYLYGSTKDPKGIVVISHGIGGGADSYIKEATYFAKRGFRVFSFSNTGSHESGGEGTMGLSQSVIDLDAALDYIEANKAFEDLPVLLFGHSWGGYAVASILNYNHEIAAAASVAGYNTPMEMIMTWGKPNFGVLTYLEYPYIWMYQKVLFGAASNLSAAKGINSVDTPVLIVHGTQDEVIAYDGPSIMAHRSEITNPNALFLSWDKEGANGHSNLFYSSEALEYVAELEASMDALLKEYRVETEKDLPKTVRDQWYAEVDREKASELDEILMQDVLVFFEEAIGE